MKFSGSVLELEWVMEIIFVRNIFFKISYKYFVSKCILIKFDESYNWLSLHFFLYIQCQICVSDLILD